MLPELTLVEQEMTRFITANTTDERLKESMLYSVEAGGKRLRPRLVLATVMAFDKPITPGVVQVAAALEMIHTYSLIHDDLPAMDNDDLRRGLPTNHKKFGDALAILAGDGLLTAAFQLVSEAELASDKTVLLLQKLAQAAGTAGMVAGQAGDIQAEDHPIPLSQLQKIHQGKTGALLTYGLLAGGILADQTDYVLEKLAELGHHLGLAFQIRDDLLDVLATTEELGKTAGKDAAAAKSTYPALLGLAEAKKALTTELAQAETLLTDLAQTATFKPQALQDVVTALAL